MAARGRERVSEGVVRDAGSVDGGVRVCIMNMEFISFGNIIFRYLDT